MCKQPSFLGQNLPIFTIFEIFTKTSEQEKTQYLLRLLGFFVGVEGLQIPLSRRAVDKITPSLRSGGSFFLFVLF